MPYRILFRRDTSTNWTSNNPVLAQGEPGWETDTGLLKIGDGSTAWISLDYYLGPTGPIGPTGSQGSVGLTGATGSTGPLPTGYASTGPNQFFGDQTIEGSVTVENGLYLNPQAFGGTASIPDGYNGSLVGPVTLTGSIYIEGSGILAIL